MYDPAGVPAATLTAPVVVFSVTPALLLDTNVRSTLDGVTGAPLSTSLLRTSATAMPPAAVVLPASSMASMAPALTGTLTVAVSQLVGALTSQIR